jgi:hypothetical protein
MSNDSFTRFFGRVTACHMVTYFVAGILAYTLLDYATAFESDNLSCYMKPTSSPWIVLGPALQVIRGFVFTAALYPFRRVFLEENRGWLKLWGLLFGLGILSTYGPSPGSIEGIIYTKIPPLDQIWGLRETVGQSLVFSLLLVGWYRKPGRAWGIVLYGLAVLVFLMSLAGAFVPRPEAFR